MKTACSVFLVSFFAFGASWMGFVYGPVHQLGGARETVVLQSGDTWPQQRTGEATLGLQVYRAYGCAACHTEQIRQTSVTDDLVVTSLGNHQAADFKDFIKSLLSLPELMNASNVIAAKLDNWDGQVPVKLYSGDDTAVPSTLADKLKPVGVKAEANVVPIGADISRHWGVRQSVAADYLYDEPVQLGNLRAGPDLSTIGVQMPDANMQLKHLYAPGSVTEHSTMPAYRMLFEVRKITGQPSSDALALPKEFAPPEGMEVVPTTEARQLVAYLLSLKNNAPLYEAPFTPATAAK